MLLGDQKIGSSCPEAGDGVVWLPRRRLPVSSTAAHRSRDSAAEAGLLHQWMAVTGRWAEPVCMGRASHGQVDVSSVWVWVGIETAINKIWSHRYHLCPFYWKTLKLNFLLLQGSGTYCTLLGFERLTELWSIHYSIWKWKMCQRMYTAQTLNLTKYFWFSF